MCSIDVKVELFRSYCSSMYTSQLWTRYTGNAIRKLYTAYHNSLIILICVSTREENSPICANLNVKSCPALIRNLIFRFMSRLNASDNNIIRSICKSSCYYTSPMWKHWRQLLYVNSQQGESINAFMLAYLIFTILSLLSFCVLSVKRNMPLKRNLGNFDFYLC